MIITEQFDRTRKVGEWVTYLCSTLTKNFIQ